MDTNCFIEFLFARARAAGFAACEAYIVDRERFSVGVKRGELTRYDVSDSLNLGFRGLLNGRIGCASTQVLDMDAAQMLVDAALEGARLCDAEDEEALFPGSPAYPEVDGARPEIARLGASERIELVRALEAAALEADPRIDSVSACGLSTVSARTRLVNSHGLDLRFAQNLMSAHVYPIAKQGEKVATAGRGRFGASAADLQIAQMARAAALEAVDFLDARSLPSGQYPVLLRADAASELLGCFSSLFSADAAQKGLSLLRGREGEGVAAPCVQIVDDALLPGGWASRPFDDEGVASRRIEVVKDGALQTLMHNLRTARKQGVRSTASAARRSCAGPMTVAPTNFRILPGSDRPAALRARAGRAILITELSGLHAGANAVSGDFSLSARGYLIENGAIQRAVRQITVSGNFLTLLREIEAVGDDLDASLGSVAAPTLLIRGLALAGE